MESCPTRSKALPGAILLLTAVLGFLIPAIIRGLGKNTAALEEVRLECAQLRADLDARDHLIANLQSELQHLPSTGTALRAGVVPGQPHASRDSELAVLPSNAVALVERLQAKPSGPEPPEQAARKNQAAVAMLETTVQDHQQKLEAVRQRTAALLLDLNVPPEISTLDAARGLDTANLRAYWPYFEAKRERELMQTFADRLAMRLLQEKVDASIEAARGNTP